MNKRDYCDLNIPVGSNCQQVCTKAAELGYKILAINTIVLARDCSAETSKKGKIGRKRKYELRDAGPMTLTTGVSTENEGVPQPPNFDWIQQLIKDNPGLRILKRITIIFGTLAELQLVINHKNCSLYDVVAVVPIHHDAVQACLTARHLSFEIISFDFEGQYWMKKVKLSRQKGSMAADREIYFEITYSSGLHGESALENMIYTAHTLLEDTCTKRMKNIVITSGALKPEEIRSPKDFNSFGFLLGLDETTSTLCIREHPLRVIMNCDSKKHGKTWVRFIPTTKINEIEVEKDVNPP